LVVFQKSQLVDKLLTEASSELAAQN
jgi:hypothetical protein